MEVHFYGNPLDGRYWEIDKSAGGAYLIVQPEPIIWTRPRRTSTMRLDDPAEYWPDAMRFDSSIGNAEIDAWQQILHPDR